MSKLDEIRSSFSGRLDKIQQEHDEKVEKDLQALRQAVWGMGLSSSPVEAAAHLLEVALRPAPRGADRSFQMVNLSGSNWLRKVDDVFVEAFRLRDYYPTYRLDYPSSICETPEEFYGLIWEDDDLSATNRQLKVQAMVQEAAQLARDSDGRAGIFGVNLPGKGCYLNGWLIAYNSGFSPLDILRQEALRRRALKTAVHEKLGHGFLTAYSAMGQAKSRLGLEKLDRAEHFKFRPAEDPLSSLRTAQWSLFHRASVYLEEGWSSWLDGHLPALVEGKEAPSTSSITLADVLNAIGLVGNAHGPQFGEAKAAELGISPQLLEELLTILQILFGGENAQLWMIQRAILAAGEIEGVLDQALAGRLPLPFRYILGALLFDQARRNLGVRCLPYAALIAANVDYNFDKVSLTDMSQLVANDARLHPDTRLAALSGMKLVTPGSVAELAERAVSELNFLAPVELRKGR